uniref:RRM domain-containing protein n=1 Tax=Plectus sambesii TaxID=2011161 RepID=A0A914WF23_9BILA
MTRLYLGGLSGDTNEDDVRRFFRGCGRISDVSLKRSFAFVEFENYRDADDAVHDLDGRRLNGTSVTLEKARHPPKGRDLDRARDRNYDRDRRYGSPDRRRHSPPSSYRRRSSPVYRKTPIRTRHQLVVKNLSSRTNWRDLKELMSKCGEVVYADVDPKRDYEGLVCFATRSEMQKALKELQSYELLGSNIQLVDEGAGDDKNSGSRSPPRRRGSTRSRSRSRSRDSSGDRSSDRRRRSRSRSRSSLSTGSPRINSSPDKALNEEIVPLIVPLKQRSLSPTTIIVESTNGKIEGETPPSPRPASETKSDDMKHSTSTESPNSSASS